MDKINYPLLYFEYKEGTFLGLLVGTGLQAMEKDLRQLKSSLLSYLQKQYKKYDEYPIVELSGPKLRIMEVPIRPAYRDASGAYPLSHTLTVKIPVVYGEAEQGYFECYIPQFDESFYYYGQNQFEALANHALVSLLNQASPARVHRLIMQPTPKLDKLTLKVNYNREFYWEGIEYKREYRILNRLAERFPAKKNIRRSQSALPEAAWELEDKVSEVIDKLISSRANVIAVGRPGSGKSAVLRQAIKKISSRSRKQQLDYTFWRILPQRITSSTKYLGEWEELCEELVTELESANGILWVEDLIRLLEIGGEGPEDSVAAFMMSFLQQGKLQMIGEASPQELESMRRLLPGFVEVFQMVQLQEMEDKKAMSIFEQFAAYSENNLRLTITEGALAQAFRLLLRYYPYESFPGKGINFLSRCVSAAQQKNETVVDKKAVIDNFVSQTGMPELFLRDDILLNTQELHDYFNSRIIGQPTVVEKLCSLVKIFKAGLNNPYKPIATLIFAGPTGVGKTASAKALADYFFGKGQRKSPLIRIDMSEFQHPGQILRLIGAGRQAGQLIRDIRERPFSVLLLDEVEKADPSVFDALLGVLDQGLLVDAYGRETNFRNTIIIMTSNLGASGRNSIGFQQDGEGETGYRSAIHRFFRPEFINRIDSIVFFNALKAEDIRLITLKELDELKNREGFTKRQIKVEFKEALVSHLATVGFDERFGARPLQRSIEQIVVIPVSNWLIRHPQVAGKRIAIDYSNGVRIELIN